MEKKLVLLTAILGLSVSLVFAQDSATAPMADMDTAVSNTVMKEDMNEMNEQMNEQMNEVMNGQLDADDKGMAEEAPEAGKMAK